MPMRQLFDKMEGMLDKIDISEAHRTRIVEFMDLCPAVCFIKEGETGKYLYVNEEFRKLIGQDAIGLTDTDLFPLEDAQRFISHDIEVLKTEKPIQTVEPLRTAHGGKKFFIVDKFIIINGGRYLGGIAVEIPDILIIKKRRTGRKDKD